VQTVVVAVVALVVGSLLKQGLALEQDSSGVGARPAGCDRRVELWWRSWWCWRWRWERGGGVCRGEEGQEFEPEPEEPEPEPLSKPTEEEEQFRVSHPSGGCKVVCVSGGVCLIDCEFAIMHAFGAVTRLEMYREASPTLPSTALGMTGFPKPGTHS
jgi:hypothetical protein